MTRLDNDLISRKALLEEVNQNRLWLSPNGIIDIITNSPTIEADSGEAVPVYEVLMDLEKVKLWVAVNEEVFNFYSDEPKKQRVLYTSAPKRQWVELTDEQVNECLNAGNENGWRGVLNATVAKLKEVNHG